jgi:hypothetical protein
VGDDVVRDSRYDAHSCELEVTMSEADDEDLIQRTKAKMPGTTVHELSQLVGIFRTYLDTVDDYEGKSKTFTLQRMDSLRRILRRFVAGMITAKQACQEGKDSYARDEEESDARGK